MKLVCVFRRFSRFKTNPIKLPSKRPLCSPFLSVWDRSHLIYFIFISLQMLISWSRKMRINIQRFLSKKIMCKCLTFFMGMFNLKPKISNIRMKLYMALLSYWLLLTWQTGWINKGAKKYCRCCKTFLINKKTKKYKTRGHSLKNQKLFGFKFSVI